MRKPRLRTGFYRYSSPMRIVVILFFSLLSVAAAMLSVYLIWLTLFAVGWGGGSISIWELLWKWGGIILVSIFSIITSIGLIKGSNAGFVFGYSIPIAVMVINVGDSLLYLELETMDFFETAIGLGIQSILPVTVFILLLYIELTVSKLSLKNYLFSGGLSLFVIGWYFLIFTN